MNRNHRRLISSMAGADPAFLAGSFATDYPASSSQEGERGAFRYFEGGYWDIRIDGGPTFQLTPNGSRIIQANGSAEDGPAMTNPPRRPPWSLVLPRHSTFLGRTEDDWQLDAGWPATVDAGSWIVPLRSLEAPGFKGTLTVNASLYVITRAQLGPVLQTLSIDRTAPAQEDLAVLESLKSTVKHSPV
ncbi:hypothetical protein [Arthrobacter sp. ov118]|jgi:hypothetical protein|uniref:hypothetical protein n=1 Tax=Arthrobacter sp. ov118 TaxID=1761747 RepID=UPI0008EBC37E|nr:hypothetical protein [Arthrobacter sp. ov118]SFT64813.1 hypothetical protein SAMN04487915_10213 [Arthrobacter sp. ov118]